MEQDKVNKTSDVGKNVWDEDSDRRGKMEQKQKKVSFREWWNEARPTKTIVFWSWMGSIVLTMIIGFAWGGWVTGGTAQKMAEVMAADAVSQRLVPIVWISSTRTRRKSKSSLELLQNKDKSV